ncbi:sodium channel and clathrin linker 1-like, partial [Asbolus verrucosus]
VEQSNIRGVLKENALLNAELNKILAEKTGCEVDHKYKESSLIENLKLQLKTVLREAYETKLNDLQNTVTLTKHKLEETINQRSQELKIKDKEISGKIQSQDNNFKIIKNLEEEVLQLQRRLNTVNKDKNSLEKNIKDKSTEIESLKLKVNECRTKVEEALQVVEAALNEKDAALLRETETREEIVRLSTSLAEVINETDVKVKTIKNEHDQKLDKVLNDLKESQEEVKNYSKKCTFLEEEIERLHKGQVYIDESSTSKLLMLEKNLENTFQKLVSELKKQNIQLKSEAENIKQDLDHMAQYYERDIKAREVEKTALKEEIKKLKLALNESNLKASQKVEVINNLSEKISTMETVFKERLEDLKQQTSIERQEREASHNKIVEELKAQLLSQTEINKKWRTEAKNITERLEKRIIELKLTLNKVKTDNRTLTDRLKEANLKMYEYRKFLQMISQDVNKITSITLPEL